MGKGEVALSGWKELEGNFRRNGNSSVDLAIQSFKGRLDEV